MDNFEYVKDMNCDELYEYLRTHFVGGSPCGDRCSASSGSVCPYCFIDWLKREHKDE